MRYFFIAYSVQNARYVGMGNLYFAHHIYPSNEDIKRCAAEKSDLFQENDVVITNIMEFKTEDDYMTFRYGPNYIAKKN